MNAQHNYLDERDSNEKIGGAEEGEEGRTEKIKFLGKSGSTFLTAKLSSKRDVLPNVIPGVASDAVATETLIAIMRFPRWPGIRRSPNWVSATYVIPELKVTVRFAVRN